MSFIDEEFIGARWYIGQIARVCIRESLIRFENRDNSSDFTNGWLVSRGRADHLQDEGAAMLRCPRLWNPEFPIRRTKTPPVSSLQYWSEVRGILQWRWASAAEGPPGGCLGMLRYSHPRTFVYASGDENVPARPLCSMSWNPSCSENVTTRTIHPPTLENISTL